MASKVHSTDDYSVKDAGMDFKLADCIRKTCSNLNLRLYKITLVR